MQHQCFKPHHVNLGKNALEKTKHRWKRSTCFFGCGFVSPVEKGLVGLVVQKHPQSSTNHQTVTRTTHITWCIRISATIPKQHSQPTTHLFKRLHCSPHIVYKQTWNYESILQDHVPGLSGLSQHRGAGKGRIPWSERTQYDSLRDSLPIHEAKIQKVSSWHDEFKSKSKSEYEFVIFIYL